MTCCDCRKEIEILDVYECEGCARCCPSEDYSAEILNGGPK
jgi:hypothetical protein